MIEKSKRRNKKKQHWNCLSFLLLSLLFVLRFCSIFSWHSCVLMQLLVLTHKVVGLIEIFLELNLWFKSCTYFLCFVFSPEQIFSFQQLKRHDRERIIGWRYVSAKLKHTHTFCESNEWKKKMKTKWKLNESSTLGNNEWNISIFLKSLKSFYHL